LGISGTSDCPRDVRSDDAAADEADRSVMDMADAAHKNVVEARGRCARDVAALACGARRRSPAEGQASMSAMRRDGGARRGTRNTGGT
jgi:hypothetical protein